MKKPNFAFLITMFEQSELVRQNIANLRKFSHLGNSLILVVSTSPKEGFLKQFDDLYKNDNNLAFLQMNWMYGNDDPRMYSMNREERIAWRQEFLPKRILTTMDKCLDLLHCIKFDVVMHIHSDSFLKPSAESVFLSEIDWLMRNDGLFAADLSDEGEDFSYKTKSLQPCLHWQPEAMCINLNERERLGYKFSKVYDETSGFIPHNYMSIEAIFGELACYCLNGKNILTYEDIPPDEYCKKVLVRGQRSYHGEYFHLTNFPGMQ